MSKLKKIIVALVVLAFVGTVGLSGCGNSSSSSSSSSSDLSGQINIFQFKVEAKDAFQKVIDEFQQANPNVKIDMETVGGGSDYGPALKAKFQSGDQPTIFNVGGPQDLETWKDYLGDLSDTQAAKSAYDWSVNAVKKNGELLGLPYSVESTGILYNKDILDKAGIDPSSITSMDTFESALKTLNEKKSDLGIDAPIAMAAKEKWQIGLQMSNMFLAPEFDNDITKAYEAKTVNFQYSDQYKKFIDLNKEYSVQPVISLDMSKQMEELYASQKVAFIWGGNWAYPTIADVNQSVADKTGIIGAPVDEDTAGKLSVGIPMYWALNKQQDEGKQKIAKAFLDFMYSSDQGKQSVLEDMKFIPAYEGYDSSKISDPISKQIYQAIQDKKTTGWVFMGYPDGWGQDQLGCYIQCYLQNDPSQDAWESQVISPAKSDWASARG